MLTHAIKKTFFKQRITFKTKPGRRNDDGRRNYIGIGMEINKPYPTVRINNDVYDNSPSIPTIEDYPELLQPLGSLVQELVRMFGLQWSRWYSDSFYWIEPLSFDVVYVDDEG